MFASKALPDRFPYRVGAVRLAYEGTLNGERTVHDPRPFDPAMHNEPNPILLSLRGRLKFQDDVYHPSTVERIARTMLAVLDKRWPAIQPASPDQIAHARKVLTRLAALEVDA